MVPFQWTSELETREPSSWAFASSSLSSPHLNHPHLSLYPSYSRAEIIRRTRYTQNPLSAVRANKDRGSTHKRPIKTSARLPTHRANLGHRLVWSWSNEKAQDAEWTADQDLEEDAQGHVLITSKIAKASCRVVYTTCGAWACHQQESTPSGERLGARSRGGCPRTSTTRFTRARTRTT